MHELEEHYLSNNAWASPNMWDRADDGGGAKPRPAAPALSLVSGKPPAAPIPRQPGSVTALPPVKPVGAKPETLTTSAPSMMAAPTSAAYGTRSYKHRVFQALQREKLLMGGERELSQINITFTLLLGLVAFMFLNWHFALIALLFGGPVQIGIRILSEEDPDYTKTYLEALRIPHLRSPE
jgi:type IV secretory pathway TrbD component